VNAISLQGLLQRVESEHETADGRIVRLCRDPGGNVWAIDGAERIVRLAEFGDGRLRIGAIGRVAACRRAAAGASDAIARIAKRLQQVRLATARA
jgi:hypothetical protein